MWLATVGLLDAILDLRHLLEVLLAAVGFTLLMSAEGITGRLYFLARPMEIAGVTLLCVAGLSYIAGLTRFIWGPIISAVIG
jgi:CHASE2 domain-containing sensor protein